MNNLYSTISIIYNPNSTGPGLKLAKKLKAQLKELLPNQVVRIIPTKYAGHAEKLAYTLAKTSARPLIISASGDGGYHEVVNGLMKAQKEGAKPIASLLPAGNANDHHKNVQQGELAKLIKAGKAQHIDLLKLITTIDGKPVERYAHSYIGIGLTPTVGQELNKIKLNWFNEKWIVVKELIYFKPVRITVNGQPRAYHSLLFSNIGTMSKVLTLSKQAKHNDGKFEITISEHRRKVELLPTLLQATLKGLDGTLQADKYDFETLKPLLMQLDGEIYKIDQESHVAIVAEQRVLRCII